MSDAALRRIGERVLDALERRDMAALRGCLDPGVRLQALQPSGLRERSGRTAVVETFAGWFADPADTLEVLSRRIDVLADRLVLGYRMRVASQTGADLVEQQGYATGGEGGLVSLRLLCSGFVAETVPEGVSP